MATHTAVLVLVLSVTCSLGGPARADDLKLTVAVVGDSPLPFQAVRLRVEVENAGPKPVTGLLPLENTVGVVGVSRDGKDVRPAGLIDLLTDIRRRGPICPGPDNRSIPVTLAPGERRAVTFPVGVRRTSVHPVNADGDVVEPPRG